MCTMFSIWLVCRFSRGEDEGDGDLAFDLVLDGSIDGGLRVALESCELDASGFEANKFTRRVSALCTRIRWEGCLLIMILL